jgi:hypothetical protein
MNIPIDLKGLLTVTNVAAPVARTATVTSSGVDLKEYTRKRDDCSGCWHCLWNHSHAGWKNSGLG